MCMEAGQMPSLRKTSTVKQMAKRIKVGEPVNAAEVWAFEFLEANLPTEYLLITNVEVPTPNGLRSCLGQHIAI